MSAKRPPHARKHRADLLMVEQNLARSIAEARAMIMAGRVLSVDRKGREARVETAGVLLQQDAGFRITKKAKIFASRAGEKLRHALDTFRIDVRGKICADIGVATGGFTDCLLTRGAIRVHAVDVAYGTIEWRLRTDPRVVLYERTNARHLPNLAFGERVDLAVVDVSFIALRQVLPAVLRQIQPSGELITLIKPQFEAPKDATEGGVIRDPGARAEIVAEVLSDLARLGLCDPREMPSPISGADGNVEHLAVFRIAETATS